MQKAAGLRIKVYERDLNMKNKLKQKELADRLGISNSYLSMILTGKRNCPSELIERLQSTLGIHNIVKNQLQSPLYTQEVRGSSPLLPTIKP